VLPWIIFKLGASSKLDTRLTLSSSKDVEELLELIVKEDFWQLIVRHIFVPHRHEVCFLVKKVLNLPSIWVPISLEKIVRLGILHLEWKLLIFPSLDDVCLKTNHQ
jgi:hypothetical protein